MGGLLLSLELPEFKLVYDGPEGTAYVHFLNGQPIIHSELDGELTPSRLKGIRKVSDAIAEAFKEKGYTRLETWAETPEQDSFNVFLGYTLKDVVKDILPADYPNEMRRYTKELH